jgi:hypothetical protein
MLKVSDNPPMLPPTAQNLRDLSGQWWVAHTRARFEKAFAWDLLERGIGFFLPMVERVTVSGGKKRRVFMPLFSSYVFLCGTAEQRQEALRTNRLCQTIEVADQEGLVCELTSIECAIRANMHLSPYPQAAVGQRCRIIAGALTGLEGVVIQQARRARVVLEVQMLGQGAVIEVDVDILETIN